LPSAKPGPEAILLDGERRRELGKAIAALPDKYRVPLLMHHMSRRSYREIALALELSESTVTGRIATALRLLRRRMTL
jgi:RNA polymerase sigma-70 factor (ECF subfamily)